MSPTFAGGLQFAIDEQRLARRNGIWPIALGFSKPLFWPSTPGYEPFDPAFNFLFNSYYESIGARHPRPKRGMLSRPSVAEVYRYRSIIDDTNGRISRIRSH